MAVYNAAPRRAIRSDFYYGFGMLGTSAMGFIINGWLIYFYMPPDEVPWIPIGMMGIAIFLGRAISAVVTPLIGYASDGLVSQWGRRKPFMVVALLPVVIAFFFLWTPPFPRDTIGNFIYLTLLVVLFRFTSVLYLIPYQSLLPELASTEGHRVRLSSWQSACLLIGMVLGGFAGVLIEDLGFLFTALIYALLGGVAMSFPLFGNKESSEEKLPASRLGFGESLLIAVRNQVFLRFTTVWAIYLMTTTFIQSSAPYIVTEVCSLGEADTMLFYIPGFLASILWYPVVNLLSKRYGKWRVFAASFLVAAIILPGTMLLGDWMPLSAKVQCASWATIQAIPIAGITVLSTTFFADITDLDKMHTGLRREGMYFSIIKVLDQLFSGFALLLLPLILLIGRSQNSIYGPLGVRLTGLIGGALMLIGFFVFLRFPKKL